MSVDGDPSVSSDTYHGTTEGFSESAEMQPAAVDVVVLSWERANDTIAAVESVLGQRGVFVTAIVVDQGSSEATLHKLRAAFDGRDNVRLHPLGYNSGCARGRNIASRLGSAEFLATLDNDAAFARPNALAIAITCFRHEFAPWRIGVPYFKRAHRRFGSFWMGLSEGAAAHGRPAVPYHSDRGWREYLPPRRPRRGRWI